MASLIQTHTRAYAQFLPVVLLTGPGEPTVIHVCLVCHASAPHVGQWAAVGPAVS
jgi:hypothetical protein